MKSIPSEEYDNEGSRNPDVLSFEVAKGMTGNLMIVLSNALIFTFFA